MLKSAYKSLESVAGIVELFERPPGASTARYLLRIAARLAFILGILAIAVTLAVILYSGNYKSNLFWVWLAGLAAGAALWIYGGFLVLGAARELLQSIRRRKP